jgi:hypothetical protein
MAAAWPSERLVAIWNSLPGVPPVKQLKDTDRAIARIWKRLQGEGGAPPAKRSGKPKAARKAQGGARAAQGAGSKGKARHRATPAKAARTGKQSAREAATPRPGSKTAQVVAMLQRKGGATIREIMQSLGWQRHTVRGFMAGAMKKAGYSVESFKPEGGERTYRLHPYHRWHSLPPARPEPGGLMLGPQ